jgi:hypothetical protein
MKDQDSNSHVLKIAGIQSTKDMCTGIVSCGASGGGLAWDDKVAASIKRKKDAANWRDDQSFRKVHGR